MEPVAVALDDQVLILAGIRSHQSHHHITILVGMPAQNSQSGFTRIELITTAVLPGIPSVTPLGCYQDLKTAAANAQVDATLSAS